MDFPFNPGLYENRKLLKHGGYLLNGDEKKCALGLLIDKGYSSVLADN